MKQLLNRVQQQLDNNHAVEAEDIQALVDFANKIDPHKMRVNRQHLKDRFDYIIGESINNCEEYDITRGKIMDEIEILIRAVE